jgi:hypothetical protein
LTPGLRNSTGFENIGNSFSNLGIWETLSRIISVCVKVLILNNNLVDHKTNAVKIETTNTIYGDKGVTMVNTNTTSETGFLKILGNYFTN